MSVHLGRAAQQFRQRHGFTMLDVATRARVSEATVHNFETGRGWRRRTDEIVQAYATEAGVDASVIWQSALDSWRRSR